MRDANLGITLDQVQTFLSAADHHTVAHFIGCSSIYFGRPFDGRSFAFSGGAITERQYYGLFDFVGVAANGVTMSFHDLDEAFHPSCTCPGVPHVTIFRHGLEQDLLASAGNHKWKMGFLHGLGTAPDIIYIVMFAMKGRTFLSKHSFDDLTGLI